ncbi:sperm-associated antigen 8-like [Watersipora subatra]|uniref:sperm-associated antigen 8-like n=1 Tax=Watersipora subatra TaxID=2589382 RepID=UPI00355AEF81
MSILNQGRNEIRVNNSDAKCLLENWVEERSVSHIDPSRDTEPTKGAAQIFKDGHKGILNTDFNAPADSLTTVREAYTEPRYPGVAIKGTRQTMMEQAFAEIAREQIEKKFHPDPEPAEYKTEFRDNYTKEFECCRPLPTRPHNVVSEQPVTFWTEHRDKVTGVSQVKTRDTVFRKNAAFSTPLGESWNPTQAYDIENVPKM